MGNQREDEKMALKKNEGMNMQHGNFNNEEAEVKLEDNTSARQETFSFRGLIIHHRLLLHCDHLNVSHTSLLYEMYDNMQFLKLCTFSELCSKLR